MPKLIDKNGNKLFKDALLWSGSHNGYEHAVTLKEDALKFKELIVVLNDKAVIMPVSDGKIMSSGVPIDYRVIACNFTSYVKETKYLTIMTALWSSASVNSTTTLTAVYGRY